MTVEEKPLFIELGSVNKQISAFCFALLDDIPMPAEDQYALGERLVQLGRALQDRCGQPRGAADDRSAGDELLLYASLPPA
jgi:hypothetical protein